MTRTHRILCSLTLSLGFAALSAPARAQTVDPCGGACTMGGDPKPYYGLRAGVALPPDSVGVAPTFGAELGLAPESGLGLGVHFIYSPNPPEVSGIGHASQAFGVEADLRWWLPHAGPLQMYPFLSAGFMTGPDRRTKENVLLPLFNPGFGARVDIGQLYAGFEFGLAALHIPFVNFTVGGRQG